MNDLPTRLRRWTHDVDAAPASDLMDEAAAEIERLRWRVKTLESAATYADAMLRERSRTGQKIAQCDSFCAVCPERDNTNHDAAPAAKANVESVAPQPTAGDRSGNPTSHSGTGNQPAPPCVEKDGLSPGSDNGVMRAVSERESPRRECGEGSLRDVPQLDNSRAAGGPEHHISDRSQPVKDDVSDRSKPISDERLAALEELSALDQELQLKHGIQGNPMIKPQVNNHPESYAKSDEKRVLYDTKNPRNGALSGREAVPDPDSRVWETPCTPSPHATPPQGSALGEGSFRDSRNANKPVAWWLKGSEYDTGCEYEYVSLVQESAEAAAKEGGTVTPLYAHPQPTLTDEEREAVEVAIRTVDWTAQRHTHAAILRGLLERLK